MREVVRLGKTAPRSGRFKAGWFWHLMLFVSGLLLVAQGLVAMAGWPEPFVPLKGTLAERGFSWGVVVDGSLSLGIGAAGIYLAVRRRDSD